MKPTFLFRMMLVLAAAFCAAIVVRAEDLAAVKARIESRADTIMALKARFVVGENNRGLLEGRGTLTVAEEKMMSDENSDRRTVYVALAGQTGAKADEVGRQRAQQLSQLAKRGMWVQSPGGQWQQKQ